MHGWMGKWLGLAALVVVLDQLSKIAAERWLTYRESVPVFPGFDLTLSYNRGAAFSFLANQGGWQRWFFTVLAVAVSAFLINWLRQINDRDRWLSASIALLLGGAIGNVIDRVLYGHVIDFIELYVVLDGQRWSWPVFNIADSAITVGVVAMIAHMLLVKPEQQRSE
jgi:signal peptidase II